MRRDRINSQNQLVRESIFTALMILMERSSFDKISITQLVNKAGVSRMSYYRNYFSKEDIINFYLDEILSEYIDEISNNTENDRYQRKYSFISCFKKNERLIRNLVNSGLEFLLLERINKFADKNADLPPENKLFGKDKQTMRFACGGLFNVIIKWANDGMVQSPEEIATILCKNPA